MIALLPVIRQWAGVGEVCLAQPECVRRSLRRRLEAFPEEEVGEVTTEAISGPLRGSDAQRFFGNVLEPVLPAPRPWWKLWGKEEREPELPAIVADLRNAA